MNPVSPGIIRFGAFELDLRTSELRKHGLKQPLPRQSIQILAMLVERPGELVLREEIKSDLWPNDTFVAFDHSINAAMNRLRNALGDRADRPRYIETLPRKGYRFLVAVERSEASAAGARLREAKSELERVSEGRSSARAEVKPANEDTSRVASPSDRLKPRPLDARSVALLAVLLLLAGFIGYEAREWRPVNPRPPWELQVIQSSEEGGRTIWGSSGPDSGRDVVWKDIAWNGPEGWLGGATTIGGGGGEVGEGVLLHTADAGRHWRRIDQRIPSGAGKFPWGKFQYQWEEVGPISAIWVYPRLVEGGKLRRELWLAATTGVYFSPDSDVWERSTPRPDDPNQVETYAHFDSLWVIPTSASTEVYATGWQGIAHFSGASRAWQLELPTYRYFISAVFAYNPALPRPDVWAVGQSGNAVNGARGERASNDDGLLYHLRRSESPTDRRDVWEPVAVSGLTLKPEKRTLEDIVLVDANTGFAVGLEGTIAKGSKQEDGTWNWAGLPTSPTKKDLFSLAYDQGGGKLWVVGDDGTVLSSNDLGQTWKAEQLRDKSGRPRPLYRVRCFIDSLWIVGNGVVYRYQKQE